MKTIPLLITALGAITGTPILWACFATPEIQTVSAKELVEKSKTIVLAQVEKAEIIGKDANTIRYHFRKITNFKGDSPETFTIDGDSLVYGNALDDFERHSSENFWKNEGGRSWHDTDCVIYPSFAVGGTFLIFPDKPYHRKSFELIVATHGQEDVRDKWLSWVEKQTKTD